MRVSCVLFRLFKKGISPLLCGCFLLMSLAVPPLQAMPVFINEIHYDNVGGDANEGVELAGVAGTDLMGWRLWFYNGSNGLSYRSLALSGVFSDSMNGYGVLGFAVTGIQNGAPDGIALVDAASQVQQFISYEGTLTALGGVATSLLSEDIGIAENAQTPLGTSLQLTGSGTALSDFQWQPGVSSFGAINALQRFTAQSALGNATVAIVPSWALLALGLLGLVWRRPGDEAEVQK